MSSVVSDPVALPANRAAEQASSSADRARRHRARIAAADLLLVACWASAALAVALYLAQGVTITGIGDLLTSGGIVAGLVGTDLVLVMLVLAARIPFIDRTIGHDKAMGTHRVLGKPAFFLLLTHGALITAGYAWNDRTDVVEETVQLIGSPDMPLAYASIGLFVVVIVTSLVAVRRRFRYEVWHVIHLLSYAAVLTALPHQLSEGTVLAQSTWQRVYWIALYVLALGSIATFRFVEPVVQSLRHRVVVESVERIAADAVSIHLRGRALDRLGAEGGQFFGWRFWTRRTWYHQHPISLSAAPGGTTARVTIRELGAGTRRLASQLRPGTPVSFEGPYGIFTDRARGRDRVAVVAAGIGATPVRALLERLDAGPGMVTVVMRASDPASLFLWGEIRALCLERGWDAWTSLGRRGEGGSGWLSSDDLARGVTVDGVFPFLGESEVYICGPDPWADAVETDVLSRRVGAAHLHRERFDW